jgi:hypothetical protein
MKKFEKLKVVRGPFTDAISVVTRAWGGVWEPWQSTTDHSWWICSWIFREERRREVLKRAALLASAPVLLERLREARESAKQMPLALPAGRKNRRHK